MAKCEEVRNFIKKSRAYKNSKPMEGCTMELQVSN